MGQPSKLAQTICSNFVLNFSRDISPSPLSPPLLASFAGPALRDSLASFAGPALLDSLASFAGPALLDSLLLSELTEFGI